MVKVVITKDEREARTVAQEFHYLIKKWHSWVMITTILFPKSAECAGP